MNVSLLTVLLALALSLLVQLYYYDWCQISCHCFLISLPHDIPVFYSAILINSRHACIVERLSCLVIFHPTFSVINFILDHHTGHHSVSLSDKIGMQQPCPSCPALRTVQALCIGLIVNEPIGSAASGQKPLGSIKNEMNGESASLCGAVITYSPR